MDKERIVGASPHWDKLKDIFHDMGLTVSRKSEAIEHISHGVLVIVDGEGLFLQMAYTYEYRCILRGAYTGAKLYHYLSLITEKERELLLLHPFVQWRNLYPNSNMPGDLYKKFCILQQYLPIIYSLIPLDIESSPIVSSQLTDCNHQEISLSRSDDDTDELSSDNKENHEEQLLSLDSIECSYLLTIPKGRSEGKETSKEAALRELQEETGIELNIQDLSLCIIEKYIGTDGNMYITYIYAAFLNKRPKVTLGQEFKGYLWLSCNKNILLRRQIRILQTFLTDINEQHTKHTCRRDHCRRLQ
jgi:ADP-ribose pyrophosphatase YjhB (NUDIX family)